MPKRKTHEEYVAELAVKNPGVTVVGEYVNAKTKIEHRCICGGTWLSAPLNVLKGTHCSICGKKKLASATQRAAARATKSHDQYVVELKAKNPNVLVVGKYVKSNIKIEHKCSCGEPWYVPPSEALKGGSCLSCSFKRKSNNKRSHAEYVAELESLSSGLTVYENYLGSFTKILHGCKEGHKWLARPKDILSGSGCRTCNGYNVRTHDEYVKEVDGLEKPFTVVGEYVNSTTKITHRCSEGHEWSVAPAYILRGYGCPHCCKIATDANVFYIWENTQDPGVYKVGITSERCADDRVKQCARDNKMTPAVILMASTPHARDIERRALELGDNVNYPDTIDGYTEFRRYSDAELGEVWRMAVGA